jgi:hypothetical protein
LLHSLLPQTAHSLFPSPSWTGLGITQLDCTVQLLLKRGQPTHLAGDTTSASAQLSVLTHSPLMNTHFVALWFFL